MSATASFGLLEMLLGGPVLLSAVMVCPGIVGLGYIALLGARLG